MDAHRFGMRVRAVRLRRGWRQADVAEKASVSRWTVLRVEGGHLDGLTLRAVKAVLGALDIDLELVPRWHGGELDRIADEGHAVLVGLVAAMLEREGWAVKTEVSFSVYGERGSIDILAWRASSRTLLVVEVKTSLNSVEETLRRLDVKVRLAAGIARERFGWEVASPSRAGCRVASMLALPDDATSRRRVQRHRPVLDRSFPMRGVEARRWLRSPHSERDTPQRVGEGARLLIFVADVRGQHPIRRIAPRRRARRPRSPALVSSGGAARTSDAPGSPGEDPTSALA